MEIRPVPRLLPSPTAAVRASSAAPRLAVDQVTLSGSPTPPPTRERTGFFAALAGLFGAPSAALVDLETRTRALSANGVEFRRHKKFLCFERNAWTAATPGEAAKLALAGKTVQASRGSTFRSIAGADDLRALDAFYGTGTPQSLPQAVAAQTLLDLEKSKATLSQGNQKLNAFDAWRLLPDTPVKLQTSTHKLTLRTEDDVLFAGWLANPATPVPAPEIAASARALEQRGLRVDGRDDDVLQAYGHLRATDASTFQIHEHGFVLGAVDRALLADPAQLDGWAGDRQAELDATKAAFGDRADRSWALLRDDGDARPFTERLAALKALESAKDPAPLYKQVLQSDAPLGDRAREAADVLAALGEKNEARAPGLFTRLLSVPPDERAAFVSRVRAAVPTFDKIAPLLPEGSRDRALDQLLAADVKALPALDRITTHLKPWSSEGAWTLDDASIRDNPDGRYQNNVDAALTTPTFSVPAGATLEYHVEHGLEQTHDWVDVDVKRDGEWTRLRRYTGQGKADERLDLPAGSAVGLRFHFHSDGSNVDTGIRFDEPKISGVPLRQHVDGPVLRLLETPPAELDALASFTERVKDARTALAAWPGLSPDLGASDFADRVEALAGLTERLGVEDALQLWSEVRASSNGTVAERGQRAAAAHDLLRATQDDPRPQQVVDLFHRLDSVNASTAVTQDLIATARRTTAFHPTGDWAEVSFHGGRAWTDSPNGDYLPGIDTAVETETVSLRGLQGTRLAFDLQHALENGYDHAYVEVHDGRQWKAVAHYTGNRERGPETVDLSAYDGQDVKLRFRIKTDKSNQADGIWIGSPRIQASNGHDVPLRDQINAPFSETLIHAATRPGPAAAREASVAGFARLGERTGSVHDAALLWPLLEPHALLPGFDEKVDAMVALHAASGTQGARDAWPRMEAAGPPSFTDRLKLYEAARTLADTLYSTTRSQRAADIYTALARVGGDRALGDSLTTLASRGKPWTAQGTWARVQTEDGASEWQDSPGGPYEPNSDMALTSQPFALVGLKNARLRFDARHAFEPNYDWCAVEVSDNGRKWKEVARYTGKGTADTVDLSPWDDKRIQVRFRIHTDGSNNDDGISIRNMRIESDNASPCDLDDKINGPLATELLEAATSATVPLEFRSRNLAVVAKMADSLQSTQEAALLWPLLAPFQTADDFPERAAALTDLTQAYGVEAAFHMWPAVNTPGGPAALGDRVALLRASFDLSSMLYRDTTLSHAVEIYQRLAQSGADRAVFDALGSLVRAARPWESSGAWTDVVDENGRHVWDDSPGAQYGNNLDTTLTSAPFSLHGLKSCKLKLDASYEFEANYDYVKAQVSEDGEHWHDLQTWTDKSQGEQPQELDLTAWCDRSVKVRFLLHSDASNGAEGMRISNMRLAVEDVTGQKAEAAIEDAINAPISNEVLDAATDPGLSPAERAHALRSVEQVAAKVGGVQAAALLWPVLAPHLRTPGFDALVDVVGALASKFGVGPTAHVMPVLQAEGNGPMEARVALFEGAHHICSGAMSPAQVEASSLELWRKLNQGGGDARVGQVLAKFTGDLQAWQADGTWGRETLADGTRAWSDSPRGQYGPNVDAALTSAPFMVSPGMKLQFTEKHVTEENYDACFVEVSSDGRDWTELAKLTGAGSGTWDHDLGAFAGKTTQVRFRMKTDGSNNAEGISLWNINVDGVPLEDVANGPFLRSVANAATDPNVPMDERVANLDLLRELPKGYARRILTFHDAHAEVPLKDILSRVIEGIPLGADLNDSLRRATLPAKKEGRVEVGDEEVVVGGIRVRKRPS